MHRRQAQENDDSIPYAGQSFIFVLIKFTYILRCKCEQTFNRNQNTQLVFHHKGFVHLECPLLIFLLQFKTLNVLIISSPTTTAQISQSKTPAKKEICEQSQELI